MIFIIKVTTNKEERAVDMITERAKKKNLNVFSVSRPHGLRGYILLEAEDRDSAEEAVFNLPYVKGIIGKTIGYEEIENMVTPSVESISIKEDDIVEMIAEPFKKEIALDLANVRLKEFLYAPLDLTIGRQELHYGNDFIMGDPDTNID